MEQINTIFPISNDLEIQETCPLNNKDTPYGSYSEAIQIDKLIEMTHVKLHAHSDYTDKLIRDYAENIVTSKLCPCATTAKIL